MLWAVGIIVLCYLVVGYFFTDNPHSQHWLKPCTNRNALWTATVCQKTSEEKNKSQPYIQHKFQFLSMPLSTTTIQNYFIFTFIFFSHFQKHFSQQCEWINVTSIFFFNFILRWPCVADRMFKFRCYNYPFVIQSGAIYTVTQDVPVLLH